MQDRPSHQRMDAPLFPSGSAGPRHLCAALFVVALPLLCLRIAAPAAAQQDAAELRPKWLAGQTAV